jgi:hypothetical protein
MEIVWRMNQQGRKYWTVGGSASIQRVIVRDDPQIFSSEA